MYIKPRLFWEKGFLSNKASFLIHRPCVQNRKEAPQAVKKRGESVPPLLDSAVGKREGEWSLGRWGGHYFKTQLS